MYDRQTCRNQSKYWEAINDCWASQKLDPLWRRHSDALNIDLLNEWLPKGQCNTILKTDLFDESHGTGLITSLSTSHNTVVGMDIADTAVGRTMSRHTACKTIRADVRSLPFPNNVFDVVVSNSTIDHFQTMEEFTDSVAEFARVLKPAGQLLMTVDNLANPVVYIRNNLPYPLLCRMGLVPYYVGVTCGPSHLKRVVVKEGLEVRELTAVEHCPRLLAVAVSRLLSSYCTPGAQNAFLRALRVFESLRRLPTRFITGYYIAVRAVKPHSGTPR